jgi:hypothetical protein
MICPFMFNTYLTCQITVFKMDIPLALIIGTVPLSIFWVSKWKYAVVQQSVYSLVRFHEISGWPGSILVAKPDF